MICHSNIRKYYYIQGVAFDELPDTLPECEWYMVYNDTDDTSSVLKSNPRAYTNQVKALDDAKNRNMSCAIIWGDFDYITEMFDVLSSVDRIIEKRRKILTNERYN